MKVIAKSVGTHDGTFHADEVTACALLILFDLIDRDKIVRTRDLKHLKECEYVCDVGGIYDPALKRFDHHQSDYTGELSSAGMVLLYLKNHKIISNELYDFFNKSLIMGIDAHDIGKVATEIGHCSFSGVIANFVPVLHEVPSEEMEGAFNQTLDFVLGHLHRLLLRFNYIFECRKDIEKAMKERKEYLIFDKPMPWTESFFDLGGEEHPALFLIMPTGKYWKLRGIPPNYRERMKVRLPHPEEWAGLLDEELEKVSGIKGAVFCHKGRFISVWKTKEAALQALHYILKKERVHD